MNFVGHAYIARNNPTLIAGNFAGDSYKGNLDKFIFLPPHILNGVRLHRYIDNYTDTSPFIKTVGKIFQNEGVTKVAYIASDILLDHYITKNWSNYSTKSFSDFVDIIYDQTDQNLLYLEEDFCFLYERLKAQKWLFQYDTEEGINRILWQFSRRLGFDNDLLKCMDIYVTEKAEIDALFTDFMASIVENSNKFIQDSLK
jgi:acyl carrier protein phosphodiesterase